MWADAAGQIFFSAGIAQALLPAYGSYNDVNKPLIGDSIIIAIVNSSASFIFGFIVWAIVGFLRAKESLAKDNISSVSLVFVAYPTAIEEMPLSNLWSILFALTIFFLGFDSAFPTVEALATSLADAGATDYVRREIMVALICFLGMMLSSLFCTNWGYVLFEILDHYLCNYVLLMVGILECVACAWVFDFDETMKKSTSHKRSLLVLTVGFWMFLVVHGSWAVLADKDVEGMLAFVGSLMLLVLPVSYFMLNTTLHDWYRNVFLCGIRRIGYTFTSMGRQ